MFRSRSSLDSNWVASSERTFGLFANRYGPAIPEEGAIALRAVFYMYIPKSWSKTKQDLARQQKIFHTSTPDLDNLIKLVKDSCNKIIWKDDSQVVLEMGTKFFSDNPRTEISVEVLE